ncbi:MAG: hypothetical protein IFK94_04255 [Acidobacteria bacterium]|uniref:VWA domain-containing protein n=1 Tax=Candidatus Polarisedimenticola svalbardensis TaxID=2886004 RepID=A0A8J7CDV7_9BACT|nr:hypothetical protein [Candidatus Polarisedimenticola svalbardensis]
MRCSIQPGLAGLLALLLCLPVAAQEEREPKELGLHTRTTSRLFQVDLSVSGDPDVIRSLQPADFKIKIGIHKLTDFILDRVCEYPEAAIDESTGERVESVPVSRPGSYLFYFDQPHLTQAGRHNSLVQARELIPMLIRDGNQAMIVSNADRLVTLTGFTSDHGELLAALDVLENDPTQLSTWATMESMRMDSIITAMNDIDTVEHAAAVARQHQREDRQITERNFHRLEATLPRLAGLPPPKVVIYFADTLRYNAGELYLGFFSPEVIAVVSTLSNMRTDALTARLGFDRVVQQASANSIRFYPIHAEGLTFEVQRLGLTGLGLSKSGDIPTVTSDRSRMAQDTLASLAVETGGSHFINGPSSRVIADRIRADLNCLLIVSFDPAPYSMDKPHRLLVKLKRKGAKLHSRGQVLFQSESKKLTDRLLAAFTAPGSDDPQISVIESLIPLDYEGGEFKALLQVAVSGVPVPGARWDVGASVVDSHSGVIDASGQMTVSAPGAPVIFEQEMSLSPGPFQIVSVAHEHVTGLVASSEGGTDWPKPDPDHPSMGPIALVQPVEAVFVRDGNVRGQGSLALGDDRPALTDRPTALVGLVCTGKGKNRWDNTRVERRLIGDAAVSFPDLMPESSRDRCIQVRDVIPAYTLVEGSFRYEIELYRDDEKLTGSSRIFNATKPEETGE